MQSGGRSRCKLAHVDPVEYLADVMPRLSRRIRLLDVPALLPAPWRTARAAAALAHLARESHPGRFEPSPHMS